MTPDTGTPDTHVLYAPVSGIVVPITDVPDPTFAGKMVGDGIAVDPVTEVLLAPCAGTITQLHAAAHALTIRTPQDIEVLLHIGLETVHLNGRGFTPQAKQGDAVRPGDPLIAFDADILARSAASLLTLMVVTSGGSIVSCPEAGFFAEAGVTPLLGLQKETVAQPGGASAPGAARSAASAPMVVLNPAGFHARPAAVLANNARRFSSDITLTRDGRAVNAKSVVAIMSLEVKQHDRVSLDAQGADAAEAVAVLERLIQSGLGENLHGPAQKPAETPAASPARMQSAHPDLLLGTPASPGLAAGRVFQLRHAAIVVEERGNGVDREEQALLHALAESRGELKSLQNDLRLKADTGKAAIFGAHEELLEDPELLDSARQGIAKGQSAAFAWQKAFTAQADMLAGLRNELLAGRANDIRDIGRRVLLHLTDQVRETAPMPRDAVLIAEDLTPSDTAGLDTSRVLGFCTTGGSATSHASILARSASLPAVAAIEERALELADGTPVILDGARGELRINPSESDIARVRALQEEAAVRRKAELEEAEKPAITLDGQRITVVGNIGGVSEAETIPALGGEGVGLLRSEFLFLQRVDAPGEGEQAAVYETIARTLGPKRDFVVRTLDVGGDKPLAYLPLPPEENPFLGVRGIRLNLLGTDLFRAQVRAVLRAAPYSRLHIMFPMVASVEEFRAAKALVLEEKEALGVTAGVAVGVMIEVPSAALLAEGMAKEADFFSIGTNDLTQYTLAMDRGHPRLAKMADALHPAVLRLIQLTVQGAHAHGKWVGVCGGLASEIPAVPVLLGLGVDELSVSVGAIPAIKAEVRRQNLQRCKELALETLAMLTAGEVRERLAIYRKELKEAGHV